MTGFLASVRTADEAALALAAGADVIDLKEPAQGALGALPDSVVAAALRRVAGRRTVSATAGDLPMQPQALASGVRRLAALGVDIVKVGIFPGGNRAGSLAALAAEARAGTGLVAVLFADRDPDFALIERLGALGFRGVMLDTAAKHGATLRRYCDDATLARFVTLAHANRLLSGLAGSLGAADVVPLAAIGPNYLGFRGALCADGRAGAFDLARAAAIRRLLDAAAPNMARAAAGAHRADHSLSSALPLIRAAKST